MGEASGQRVGNDDETRRRAKKRLEAYRVYSNTLVTFIRLAGHGSRV